MRVRVLFFGMLRELAGRSSESLELPAEATVSDVLARYRNLPRMADFLPSLAISVNQEYARPGAPLHDNDEIALLPPVSGGGDASPPAGAAGRTRLVREKIQTEQEIAALAQPSDGALAVFEGIVRNHSRGRRTLFLDYEAYESMATKQLEELANDARQRFGVRNVLVVHRIGRLEISEISVLIAVAAAHRKPAFEACRWLIDTLKRTVPIWKKEHFADGAVWAEGEPFPSEIVPSGAGPNEIRALSPGGGRR